jgi:D-alanyl-D-alanine carboxypeptidase (penicillin-binding protein 5/6)
MLVPRRLVAILPAALALACVIGLVAAPAATARPASTTTKPASTTTRSASATVNQPAASLAGVHAAAAELANGSTGKRLWARQQYGRRPIASITKIMTALVVLRAGRLGRRIRITRADVEYVQANGASNAGLHAGDVLTARQLLYAMLLPSGADAALALATSYGPGWQAFVRRMNAEARRLQLRRTHFTNFDGLMATDVSTPRNLLLLGEAVMRQPVFRDVVKRRFYSLHAARRHHRYLWRNSNLLLGRYPGVIGIKTGWTPVAGECLLFEATHGKRVLIGVVLDSAPTNSGVTFTDAARMLNWGFGLHRPVTLPRMPARVPPG